MEMKQMPLLRELKWNGSTYFPKFSKMTETKIDSQQIYNIYQSISLILTIY